MTEREKCQLISLLAERGGEFDAVTTASRDSDE